MTSPTCATPRPSPSPTWPAPPAFPRRISAASSARTFGETPHRYLLTRRLERAALLLRTTDRRVADVCFLVGLGSVGSFTTSFRRMFGMTPMQYRQRFPPASSRAVVPSCIVRFYGRPQNRTFREDRRDISTLTVIDVVAAPGD